MRLTTADLTSVSELIKKYESHPSIKSYLKDEKAPTNHRERVIYEFYKRCVAERVEILNYQLYGAKKQAMYKAQHMPRWLVSLSFFHRWSDRPYKYSWPSAEHYFDSANIDLASHRVDEFSIEEANQMEALYTANKARFYRQYFKRRPVAQHFHEYEFYLAHLPYLARRKTIFNELVTLFKRKHWIGFYALALPQVEGLFSEMCSAVSSRDLSQKGLPVKVKEVRPYHALSDRYFDYYEYHIPLQRNKFAHTGYDEGEDFKLKSFDLLVDINHLLKVFYELDNPLVKVVKMFRNKDIFHFATPSDFSKYFALRNALSREQSQKIRHEAEAFDRDFLSQCSPDYICYEVIQQLPDKIDLFNTNLGRVLAQNKLLIDIKLIYKPELTKLIASLSDELLEELSDFLRIESDSMQELQYYQVFLAGHKKYLPFLDEHVKTALEGLKKAQGNILRNTLEFCSSVQDRVTGTEG